jgi:hypothetical protein
MQYLKDIKFCGDLSLEDADLFMYYGRQSPAILEFGMGGSTQLFAQCMPKLFISLDTSPEWMTTTQARLNQIETKTQPEFYVYEDFFKLDTKPKFDLILVDGVDHLRRDFAVAAWPLLNEEGIMIFHDTRRFQDFQNAAWVAHLFHNEVSEIQVNEPASNGASSNITVIYKKRLEPYVNWNYTENKPQWAYGDINYSGPLWQYSEVI